LLTLAGFAVTIGVGTTIAVGVSSASTVASSALAVPQTVTATLITRHSQTLAPGARVSSTSLGQRVFPTARVGFALADVNGAQYPAATANGGLTWRTNGPALHLDAAQAPLVVLYPGAASTRTFFAFGGGQVVDATGDGGRHWWRAILGDAVVAVVPRVNGGLAAFAQRAIGTGVNVETLVYVSSDGGHHWHYTTRFAT
jgi:hypothetical protein